MPRRLLARASAAAAVALASTSLLVPAASAAEPVAQDVQQFACPPGQVQDAGFTDVSDSRFRLEINCLSGWSITSGVTANSYAPSENVTRAQMAQFIARVAERHGGLRLDPADAGFGDISGLSQPTRDAINGLANAGIVKGVTGTAFDPASPVARDQMATFLARLQDQRGDALPPGGGYFDDVDGNTHEGNINRVAAAGIVVGTGERKYSPQGRVTRQQMSGFLMRYVADRVDAGDMRSVYAQTADRALLAERTVLRGTSTGKIPVRLAEPATLPNVRLFEPGGITVTGQGRYVGWALVADGDDPNRIILTGGRVATGLPADGTGRDSAVLGISMTAALDPVSEMWELPAGDYHLYLVADGTPVEVTLPFKGLTGTATLTPTVPVSHRIDRPDLRYGTDGNGGGGSSGTLAGPGLLMQLGSTLSSPSFQQTFTNCYYVGEEASAGATYAPGCPEADVFLPGVYTNPNIGDTSLYTIIAGSLSQSANTFGQGYSMTNAGVTENVEFESLWLTF